MKTNNPLRKLAWLFSFGRLLIVSTQPVLAQYSVPAAEHFVDIPATSYQAPSGAYFAAPWGSTANSGRTFDKPWPLVHAIETVPSGSTIVLRGGDYRDLNGQTLRPGGSAKKLILQAYAGEKPWIKGSQVVSGWTQMKIGANTGWKYNSNWPYPFPAGSLPERGEMVFISTASVKNKALKQVLTKEEVGPGRFCVEITDATHSTLYIGDNPTGNTVEVSRYANAFKKGEELADDMAFKGLGFVHFAETPFASKTRGMLTENCTFAWNGRVGGNLQVYQNGTFKNNICRFNGESGLNGNFATNTVVEGNTISNNNIEGFSEIWAAAGMKIISTTGLKIRSNTVENNYATGIWLDVGTMDCHVVRNTVRKNGEFGIFSEISHRTIIGGNKVYDNSAAGICLSDATENRVYNNTLMNNGRAILVKDTERENRSGFTPEIYVPWVASEGGDYIADDNEIKNNIYSSTGNILFDADGAAIAKNGDVYTFAQSAAMFTSIDYNAYYQSTAGKIIEWRKQPSPESSVVSSYTSLATYKNETAASFEDNSEHTAAGASGHPYFVDGSNTDGDSYDFRIKSTAPAKVRTQRAYPDAIADAIGWPRGTVHMGAIQTIVTARESFEVNSREEVSQSGLSLYPNPTSDKVSVSFFSDTAGKATIKLTDVSSREFGQMSGEVKKGMNRVEMLLDILPEGVYLINVQTPTQLLVQKLMVTR